MSARARYYGYIVVLIACWLIVLAWLGLPGAALQPRGGLLTYTFEAWNTIPLARHLLLAQFTPTEFSEGAAYTSYTYPFLLGNFALVAPFHYVFRLPWKIAPNSLPFVYMGVLLAILAHTSRYVALEIPYRLVVLALAIGVLITNPLPWTSLLFQARDNFHVLSIAGFCYVSTALFYDRGLERSLFILGIFLACWAPIFLPAWLLCSIYARSDVRVTRRLMAETALVFALGALNLALPNFVLRIAGLRSTGSGLLYRSGLDGSTSYFHSIGGAIVSPHDPRHWPIVIYVVSVVVVGVYFQYRRPRSGVRAINQLGFLAIPYATIAALLPQYTSIHPYTTDLLLVIPAAFLTSFWLLQKDFWKDASGREYALVVLGAIPLLMTNLLTLARAL